MAVPGVLHLPQWCLTRRLPPPPLLAAQVDLSNIQEGQTVTVKWRGKPVFIRHRCVGGRRCWWELLRHGGFFLQPGS